MTEYLIENLNAPGQYLSIGGNKNADENGTNVVIWNNPDEDETRWYIFHLGGGNYNIANVMSNKCVNVSRHARYNGGNIITWDNPESWETRFKVQAHKARDSKGDYFTIESCYTPGHCLNASGNRKTNGTNVLLWNNRSTWSTQWKIYSIDGKAFNPNERAAPNVRDFLNSKAFGPFDGSFSLGPKYVIENVNARGKYLSTHGHGEDRSDNGKGIVSWDSPDYTESQWHLIPIEGGKYYNIMNARSKKCLNVSRHKQGNGGIIIQWDNPRSWETRFRIIKKTIWNNEVFLIESVYNGGHYLNVSGNRKTNGAKILLWDNYMTWSTQWLIREVHDASL